MGSGSQARHPFHTTVTAHGRDVVLTVRGEINHETYHRLADAALRALAGDEPDVVVDMSAVTYCNASGIKVLRHAADHARVHGRRISIATGKNPNLLTVLEATGLAATLHIANTVTSALAHTAPLTPDHLETGPLDG